MDGAARKRFSLVTLGCTKNQVDSEAMKTLLRQAGHSEVADAEQADLVVVNTCGFIESAKQESERLARLNPGIMFFVLTAIGAMHTHDPIRWTETDEIPF